MVQSRHRTIKYCAYFLLTIAAFVLQNSRGTSIGLWGASVDLIPFLIVSIALFDGPYPAGALGFLAGLLFSLHSFVVAGLYALYLGLFGVLFGVLGMRMFRRVLPSALMGGVVCILGRGLGRYVLYHWMFYGMGFGVSMMQTLGELILSILPGALAFFIVRAISRRFGDRDV